MKKIIGTLLAILFCGQANAQILDSDEVPVVNKNKEIKIVEKIKTPDVKKVEEDIPVNEKELKKIIEEAEETPPTEVTEEERIALRIEAKKDIQRTLRNRTPRDRRGIVDALNFVEKMKVRQAAISQGLSDKEVEEAEAEVKVPTFDPLNDEDVQEYLFEQNGLNDNKKTEIDNNNEQ